MSGGQWTLRDLDSRNGTMVGQRNGPRRLAAEARRHRSASATPNWSSSISFRTRSRLPATRVRWSGARRRTCPSRRQEAAEDEASVLVPREPTTITHRRGQTKFLAPGRGRRERRLEDRPGGGEAVPAGLRVGQGARRGRDGRVGAGGPGRRDADRRRRVAAVAGRRPRPAARRRPGGRRLAEFHGAPLPSRLELSGLHGDARRRSRAGAKRAGRQHLGHPRQPGRNPRHQRDLRPGPPRQPGVRIDPPLFHRPADRARPGRPRVHPGRGRHRGRGRGEHPPPAGAGRKPHPRAAPKTSSCASGWASAAKSSAAARRFGR